MKPARRLSPGFALYLFAVAVHGDSPVDLAGHFKYRFSGFDNPGNSLFRETAGASTIDHGADTRMKLSWDRRGWGARADYQFIALEGDMVRIARANPGAFAVFGGQVPDDARRLFDLSHVVSERDDLIAVSRLDRLGLGNLLDRFGSPVVE